MPEAESCSLRQNLGARLSAVNAETGMRRYNVRSADIISQAQPVIVIRRSSRVSKLPQARLRSLYQVANATANHRYVFPPLFSKKSSSFCIYVVLLSYHTKQSHIHKNCYAYFTMDF